MAVRHNPQSAARSLARRLAVQALYRWQLNTAPWQDLITEFAADADMPRADREYFTTLVRQAVEQHAELDAAFAPLVERNAALLDPIEHAVLLVAGVELRHCPQVPFRVVIDRRAAVEEVLGTDADDAHTRAVELLSRPHPAVAHAEIGRAHD
jgi:N utilization substance protein B